ncbi:MAG: DUF1972 domain-containing protein [Acidobacteria bacterium]|nr:DUF1972 domain-containing protein [Acidobacteriota bacterium]
MRIAILGTRGIPANYGGFETFAEELATRLAARGHELTVYGRSHHVDRHLRSYRGVRLVVLPTIRHKYFDTVAHTFLSTLHALGSAFDVALYCNAANAIFCALPRLRGTAIVLNVDGVERRRRKWNLLGRAWYLLSERLATWCPHAVVTDAQTISRYYRSRYGTDTSFIPYGAGVARVDSRATLDRLGLQPNEYFLYVSRFEPENNARAVIEGYAAARVGRPLVMVGDAPYAADYVATLKRLAGPNVRFTGFLFGEAYRELQTHAFAYIHGTEVGGTHPALVEAMGVGGCPVVNDVEENREVAGDAALYFTAANPVTLAAALERLEADERLRADLSERALARAAERFSWDRITDDYERLFKQVCGLPR